MDFAGGLRRIEPLQAGRLGRRGVKNSHPIVKRGSLGEHLDFERRAEYRVGRSQLVSGGVLHGMNREAARVEHQFAARGAVHVERDGAFQHAAAEANV